MPKEIIKYPTGVTRERYVTKRKGPAEQTYGKVKQTAFANRVYYKPSLRKPVIRHPGVRRVSEDVRAINKQLEKLAGKPEHPSYKCGGLDWAERIKCLRREMRETIKSIEELLPKKE